MAWETIAVGHGPMVRYNLPELVGKYQSWSEEAGKSSTSGEMPLESDSEKENAGREEEDQACEWEWSNGNG